MAEELPPLVGVIPESGVPEFGQEAFMDMLREGAAEAVHKGRQSVDAAMAKMTADLRDVAARRPKQMPVLNSLLEGGDLASGLVPDAEDLPLAIHALTLEVRSARNLHSEVKRGASFVQHLLGKERGVRKLVRVTKEAGLDAARLRVLEASYEDAARRRLMYWLSRVTKESHPGATVHVVRRKSWNDARYAFELRKKADKILQERGLIRYMESIGIVHGVETSKKGSTSVVRKLGDELRTWLRDNVKFPAAKEGARKPMLFERLYGAYASFLPISLAENMSFQAPRFVASRATKEFFEGVAHSTKLHGLELADRKGELVFLSRKYGVPFASPGEFDAYLFSRFGTHPALHRARVDWLVEHGDPGGRFAQSFGNLSEQARAEIIERAARIRGEMEDAGVHVPEGLRHLEEVWAATNPIHIQDSKSALRVIERVAKEFAEGDERLEAEIIALLKNEPNHRPDIHYSVNDGIAGAVMSGYIDDVNESFSTVVNALKRSEPRVAAASKRSALVRKKLGTVYPSGAQPLLFNSTMGAVLSDATERVEQVVRRIVRDAGIEASVPERVVADFVGDVRRLISSPTATDVSDVSLELTWTVVKFWDEVKVAVRDSDSSVVLATSLMDTQRALVDAVIRARGPRQVIAELRQRFQDILSHPDKLARLEPEQADELISAVENLRTEFEEWDQALRDSISFARRQPIGQLEAELLGLQNVAKDDPVLAGVYEMQALVRESSRGAGRETTFAMLEGMKRELLAATERDAAQAAVTDKKLLGALDTLHDLDDVGSTLAMAKENVLRPSLRVLEEAGLLEPGVDMSILSTSPRLMRAAIGVEIVDRFLTHGEISRKAWSRTVLEVVDDLAGRA
ncbi:MAG: hypothetical protein ACE5EF_11290, partial [Dehalococcoidia bacterium]